MGCATSKSSAAAAATGEPAYAKEPEKPLELKPDVEDTAVTEVVVVKDPTPPSSPEKQIVPTLAVEETEQQHPMKTFTKWVGEVVESARAVVAAPSAAPWASAPSAEAPAPAAAFETSNEAAVEATQPTASLALAPAPAANAAAPAPAAEPATPSAAAPAPASAALLATPPGVPVQDV